MYIQRNIAFIIYINNTPFPNVHAVTGLAEDIFCRGNKKQIVLIYVI